MNSCLRLLLVTLPLLSVVSLAWAEEVYIEPGTYVMQQLSTKENAQSLWITGDLRRQAEEILGHRPLALRQRYWREDDRTVWILEEIGKEEPITAGFVVDDNHIVDATVLIFRESRGWEIRYQKFTEQFLGSRIDETLALNRSIDGISGATLSVNAMRKLARLALAYHHHVMKGQATAALSETSSGRTGR